MKKLLFASLTTAVRGHGGATAASVATAPQSSWAHTSAKAKGNGQG